MNKVIYSSFITVLIIIGCKKENPVPTGDKLPYENDSIKIELASASIPSSITDIYFFNKSTGIAITAYGEIYKITNNGFTWTIEFINPVLNQPLNKIYFTDTNSGYVVGGSNSCSEIYCNPPGAIILKTTNGGNNWLDIYEKSAEEFVSISVNSSGELFAVSNNNNGKGRISKSLDGGRWTTVDSTDFLLNKITFNDNYGFCTGANGKILRSNDNGSTWSLFNTLDAILVTDLKFSNGVGFCITNNMRVFKTTDNGSTWTETLFSDKSSFVLNPLTVNSCLVFGGGRYVTETKSMCGAVRLTLDSGSHWREIELVDILPISLTSFYSTTEGYIVAGSKLIRVTVK